MNWFSQRRAVALLLGVALIAPVALAQDWQSSLTPATPGSFPPLRPLRATYRFGWSGFTAATADMHLARSGNNSVLEAKARTVDMARPLWPFDAEHMATADTSTLRPIEVKQTESERSKRVTTTLAFDAHGVTAKRGEVSGPLKARRFDRANFFDLQTSLLFTRSQPLTNGSATRFIIFPGKDPYLVILTVLGRERVTIPAGTYNAIKLDLKLNKIGKNNELKPHKKFRKATVWLSDDGDRIPLRAEAEVFIGSVFAELQSVEFENGPARVD
ncbi:MAG: DUF3108 domain-containing protein [Chthoniobacterales bacterium]